MELAGTYEGEYLNDRFHGRGVYKYQGMRYEGHFLNGFFHGEGTLFVKGGVYKGFWHQGKLIEGGFVFEDGLEYMKVGHKYWDYCSEYDHRFYQEIKDKIPVEGPLKDLSAHNHALPKGCYDTIDGYYDPKKHVIFNYETHEEMRTPDSDEIDFILKNCRVGK